MIDVTPDDIARLNDEQLRALVGRLCEAEMRHHGFSPSAVTWGGNQNAADGGLDVRVALPSDAGIKGFVPRAATGFQVKKPDMPANVILKEMRPRGVIRPVIAELARESGAYIIVSSGCSASDSMLNDRLNAMRKAVDDVAERDRLLLKFYDRCQLATWVRHHPGLILWVREAIDSGMTGWHPHGAWAYAPEGESAEYLLDEQVRITPGNKDSSNHGMSALEAIERIRGILSQPKHLVRLVGLSGVGKTRLVQALFDDRIGKQSLDPAMALYTNMADSPDPLPIHLASNLIATRTPAILIIDNCPPDLHQRLGERCRSADSSLSVITVEYDIRDDDPEGTEFFELKPSSNELIKHLIAQRFLEISQVDTNTIAEFSGGNARVAIALASGVGHNETITGLSDNELFRRLFQQTHQPDDQLLEIAQACSLVYSFDGENLSDGGQEELAALGALVGKTARDVFRGVAKLSQRDLVQKRGVWRAILPHAIANRLAATALQEIPREAIIAQLVNGGSERLLRSFSRRLGYLHDSQEARAIVESWLEPGGLLHEVENLGAPGKSMLINIAPVSPAAMLSALERAMDRAEVIQDCSRLEDYAELIRKLAYDAANFERCILLLARLAEADTGHSQREQAEKALLSLFQVWLSGTHATIEQRIQVSRALIESDRHGWQRMGQNALRTLLEARPVASHYDFDFGARSRDYGYWPSSRAETKHWFQAGLNYAMDLACSSDPNGPAARLALADHLRCLWSQEGLYEELEQVCRAVGQRQFWREGWIAVKQTIYYDTNRLSRGVLSRLNALEELLRPKDLAERVRAIALNDRLRGMELSDVPYGDPHQTEHYLLADSTAETLGRDVAIDETTFNVLLTELVTSGGRRLKYFGRGLANGFNSPRLAWNLLVAQWTATPEKSRYYEVLCGFLDGLQERDVDLVHAILDDAANDAKLKAVLPILQSAVSLDARGVGRLMESLRSGNSPIWSYRNISLWRTTDVLAPEDVRRLLLEIASKPDGSAIAVYMLHMRVAMDESEKQKTTEEIIGAGQVILYEWEFTRTNANLDYELGELAKTCLVGSRGRRIAEDIAKRLKAAVMAYRVASYEYQLFIAELVTVQPIALLNGFFGDGGAGWEQIVWKLHSVSQHQKNPLEEIPMAKLLSWCAKKPALHYPIAASVIQPFHRTQQSEPSRWTKLALRLIDKAPDRNAVLTQFMGKIMLQHRSGSRVEILTSNAQLIDDLMSHPDESVRAFLIKEKAWFDKELKAARDWETKNARDSDQRFE